MHIIFMMTGMAIAFPVRTTSQEKVKLQLSLLMNTYRGVV
jgi:hypothetical protein